MGEIKSAFELAMERSKKYSISDAEREEIKEKEIQQKAMGLFHRHKEGHLSLNELTREIERMDEKTREKVKEALLSQWVDVISLDDDSSRFLDAIESIQGRGLHEIRDQFRKIMAAYQKEADEAKKKMRLQRGEELRSEGIYGDAVDPNVEGREGWKNLLDAIHRSHREKLDQIKETLRKL